MLVNERKTNCQITFFNERALTWDERCHHDMLKVNAILDLLDIQVGDYILDVGTGTGVLIPELVKRVTCSGYIKAVDIAEKMIEVAKKKHHWDFVDIQWEDALINEEYDKYHHIICYSMFPHFKDQELAINTLAKKLKSGGRLSICHSQSRHDINTMHQRVHEVVKKDRLPDINTICTYFHYSGLMPLVTIDNQEMYVASGIKP